MRVSKRTIGIALIVSLAVGYGAHILLPPKRPNRPYVRLLSKAARTALWLLMFAEDMNQEDSDVMVSCPGDQPCLNHSRSL